MRSCLTTLIFSLLFLSGCSELAKNSTRSPVCKELNSRIVFSGATGNSRQAQIQNAQENNLINGYDKQCDH